MDIRFAQKQDITDILKLLAQVNLIHHQARPDILKKGTKYTYEEVATIIDNPQRPILVAVEDNHVLGYMFGIFQETTEDNILVAEKSLYIDDICIDQDARGKHVGQALYQATKDLATDTGCRRITLNVWDFNDSAKSFYKKMGMQTFKTTLEDIL
ncbi:MULTISPECIES: GNAT family N-acetyltransferase [Aerococcus]|uniref:N-acetyltransferase n=1 Tax=Aerococcus viridans TaxID=1377 RepID=A0A2N6UE84_9LACT|nr:MULTISPECIES: GNAT family N-acetyltransferase [Aerococcus]OFU49038.1 GNAT family acetyltransferase [Aerococcus sp. HMSC10H05]PMC79845.1 N-acetyltransferase [Aerococcus viridans]